jgi:hypothetical protein
MPPRQWRYQHSIDHMAISLEKLTIKFNSSFR